MMDIKNPTMHNPKQNLSPKVLFVYYLGHSDRLLMASVNIKSQFRHQTGTSDCRDVFPQQTNSASDADVLPAEGVSTLRVSNT